ncbi:Transcriptional regulator, TetR family [Alloactinosynnema sp. L-07]|uniref:TetR/AcrR family transcriptional regulator n=1 Tax=Alloactinosynnema sp. L-07 TaxID=1653480 RepID=UPI00065EEFC3|nr:TetR/AcrR family transcriptional regulator [Alloactinosynnema sp. L-07]CRK59535.1 Transcriptional regulator, TetR family [Alloactinosynnema sp. L-07]
MSAPDTPYQVRRTPTQFRATRQIERILDAAARVVVDKGFSAATTADIAKTAKVSIGSVYRYFPDKLAVMRAVVERNTLRYQDRVTAEAAVLPVWHEAVARAYSIYVGMCRTDEGFRAISNAGLAAGELDSNEFDDPLADGLADVLVDRFGFIDTAELRVTLLQAVTIGDVLTRLAFRLDPTGHEDTLAKTAAMVHELIAVHAPSR